MQNLLYNLLELLKEDKRVSVDGKILKNKLTELGLKLDIELINLLLTNKKVKEHFFISLKRDGGTVLIFNKEKFVSFINNKEFLPDSFTSFKNRIGLASKDEYLKETAKVCLVWPFKDCVLEGGQEKEDQKREEIFYNEILAPDEIDRLFDPKVLTNFSYYDVKGKHKVDKIKITDNLIIEGNNLLALHCLKYKYRNKVKLIYIDPPYNTGSDSFKYNDKFNHSTWLTFMKNRLEIAKEFLSSEGIIFVQCDDKEHAYLKVLMDEIFGKNNFQSNFYVQVRYPAKQLASAMRFHKLIENVLIYSKSESPIFYQEYQEYDFSKYIFRIEEEKPFKTIELGGLKVDVFNKDTYKIYKEETSNKEYLKEIWASGKILDSSSSGRFFRDYLTGRYKKDGYGVLYKVHGIGEGKSKIRYFTGPKREGAIRGKYYQEVPERRLIKENQKDVKVISNYYDFAANFGNCRHEGGVELRSGKKPEILLKRILDISTDEGDLVMDFFMGTGTTCAVAHKTRRQYIGIEQMDYGKNNAVVRLKNVIKGDQTGISKDVAWKKGGSFIYMELKEWNQNYMNNIQKADSPKKLIKIYENLKKEAFFRYDVDLSKFDKKDFLKLSLKEQKKILSECLDKNHLYVNFSEIEDLTYEIKHEEVKLNKEFYVANY